MFARPKDQQQQQQNVMRVSTHQSSQYQIGKYQKGFSPQNSTYESPNKGGLFSIGKIQSQKGLDSSVAYTHRVDRLEDVVNKLTNQYDALMPLLNLVENAPLLIKKENLIANLQKKFQVTEERSLENSKSFEQFQSTLEQIKQDLQNQVDNQIRSFENKFFSLEQKLNDQVKTLQNNETRITRQVNKIEGKQREDLQIQMRKYDSKYIDLDNQMKQLTTDVTERIQALDVERQKMKRSQVQRRDSNIMGKTVVMSGQVEGQIDKKIQSLQKELQKQVDNLGMDLGILQCDFELQVENDKRFIVAEQSKQFPKDIPMSEKMIKINQVELQYQIEQVEKFNVENTQRIIYELKNADEVITNIEQVSKQYPANFSTMIKEVDKFENRLLTLKGQVEGSNKKTSIEISKLDEKFQKTQQFKDKVDNDSGNGDNKIDNQLQDDLQAKINEIKNSVDGNLNLVFDSLEKIQNKVSKYIQQRTLYLNQYSYMQSELTQKDDQTSNQGMKSSRVASASQYKKNRLKDSFIKRSVVQSDQNRSGYSNNDDSYN